MPFFHELKIRFEHVDAAGILYYPRFLGFCHQAFEAWFDNQGPFSYSKSIGDLKLGFPTVKVEADFLSPLFHGDVVLIQLAVLKIGKSSLVTGYEIRRKPDSKPCFSATVTTVLIDLSKRRPLPIEGELRSFLERFLK